MMSKFRPAWLLLIISPMVTHVLAQPVEAPPLVDIFAVRSWEPPPPVAAEMSVPAEPEAPPLPFRFLGRIVDANQETAYLLNDGSRVLVVVVGDVIGNNYRLEKYENGRLLFRYRPMNLRQELDVGEQK